MHRDGSIGRIGENNHYTIRACDVDSYRHANNAQTHPRCVLQRRADLMLTSGNRKKGGCIYTLDLAEIIPSLPQRRGRCQCVDILHAPCTHQHCKRARIHTTLYHIVPYHAIPCYNIPCYGMSCHHICIKQNHCRNTCMLWQLTGHGC